MRSRRERVCTRNFTLLAADDAHGRFPARRRTPEVDTYVGGGGADRSKRVSRADACGSHRAPVRWMATPPSPPRWRTVASRRRTVLFPCGVLRTTLSLGVRRRTSTGVDLTWRGPYEGGASEKAGLRRTRRAVERIRIGSRRDDGTLGRRRRAVRDGAQLVQERRLVIPAGRHERRRARDTSARLRRCRLRQRRKCRRRHATLRGLFVG